MYIFEFTCDLCVVDPCEPNMCNTAKNVCFKSSSCQGLYEDWEMKCKAVWESTSDMCSEDCKTATQNLYQDQFGQYLKWCDCGSYENVLAEERSNEELTALTRCFERKYKMKELCKIEDAGQCQMCRKNKGVIQLVHTFSNLNLLCHCSV